MWEGRGKGVGRLGVYMRNEKLMWVGWMILRLMMCA